MMRSFNVQQLKNTIRNSIKRVYIAQHQELDLYRNTLDCFSASIDALVQGISLDEWLVQEKARQIQKTKQNAIGDLHQEIMGSIDGVVNLAKGNIIDIACDRLKIVAEIKNKHNTTKGNHKIDIYDDLVTVLNKPEYHGYTGYCVEVLPKSRKTYNQPFTPPDNRTKQPVRSREDIRVIDGRSFYALLTGCDDTIDELYQALPILVSVIIEEEFQKKLNPDLIYNSPLFDENFNKAY